MKTIYKSVFLLNCFLIISLASCGSNCVECDTSNGIVEFCDDLNYTDINGNPISFDEFVASQTVKGIICD